MKRSLAALAATFAVGGALVSGSALANSLTDTFTVNPSTINPGDLATLNLTITINLTGPYTGGYFTDGTVRLYSGIGNQHTTFDISNPKPSTVSFSHTYLYPTLGSFTPKYFEYDIKWAETYTYTTTQTYECGEDEHHEHHEHHRTCTRTVTHHVKTNFEEEFDSGKGTLSVTPLETIETLSVATPLPAALPLFASGLGAFGYLGWRRKRKNAAADRAA